MRSMNAMNAIELWIGFREGRSEAAFGELVRRYTSFVYSVARRRLPGTDQVQDATQQVFIRLARGRPELRGDAELVAWLHRTTVHVSIDLWRAESRRRTRERQAVAMPTDSQEPAPWQELAPEVDQALDDLSDADRQAILLRFFDHKSMRELGEAVGVSEDAAKMRVSRALERLRGVLTDRGVACTTVSLGAWLGDHAVEAAPASVVGVVSRLPMPSRPGSLATSGIPQILNPVLRLKLVAGLVAVVGLGGLGILLVRDALSPADGGRAPSIEAGTSIAAVADVRDRGPASNSTTQESGKARVEAEPDPLELLKAVAAARLAIPSGTVNLEATSDFVRQGRRWTNQVRMDVVFDGERRRFEQRGTEYVYRFSADEAEQERIRQEADGMSREAAVRAGLLRAFEARVVSTYDGTSLLSYRESDGKSDGATISDPARGISDHNFDPRTLGLAGSTSPRSSIEGCLAFRDAKQVRLIGREYFDGAPAWHVQVSTAHDVPIDFWLDAERPTRVLKTSLPGQEVVSTYDDRSPVLAIPQQVVFTHGAPNAPFGSRITVSEPRYGVPVDPKTFTLAGLSMAVGTPVADVRLRRRIGYWTGSRLTEGLPGPDTKDVSGAEPPGLAEWLAVLDSAPSSSAGLEAALGIVGNTPDGPPVEKAASVILEHHVHATNLVGLCEDLIRMHPRCSVPLLEGLVAKNPSRDVRGTASFVLATFHLEAAEHGVNREESRAAERWFERVNQEFGDVTLRGRRLDEFAAPLFRDLRLLSIGKPGPSIEGITMDGQPIRLSDHRGKVVVLIFWCRSVADDVVTLTKVLGSIPPDRIAVLGINGDEEQGIAREAVEKQGFGFPSVWDKRDGPIAKDWNVNGWVTTYVLDGEGIIRGRHLQGRELARCVETVLGR